MPELTFQIEEAVVAEFAATSSIIFKLRVSNRVPGEIIHTVALRAQIQIETTRRRYTPEEQSRMLDLYGEPERWSQTLRTLLWTHASVVIPSFQGETVVDLHVPCTFDFNVAATKYFSSLSAGEIPLCFQFSGTVFYAPPGGNLQVGPISWDQESRFKLPVGLWREMMNAYYPNTAWVCLRRDVFDRLNLYKMQHGIPTWEQVMETMLAEEETARR
ncbi:MAG TPA: DUF6084 family protein [Candidatus Angelobacter sp.]|jgi:hypothetical protein|nr:DUF6084 family protein [Candidatus Angelobacter sp.]